MRTSRLYHGDFRAWCYLLRENITSPEHQAKFDAMTEAEKEVMIHLGLADGTLRHVSAHQEAMHADSAAR